MFKKIFSKNKKQKAQSAIYKKSLSKLYLPYNSIVSQIQQQYDSSLTFSSIRQYITFYQYVAPLSDAIDLIVKQFSSITPKIFDSKTKSYLEEHPLLELLKNPNRNTTYYQFIERTGSFYELTGNNFWIVNWSKLNKIPLELTTVPPQTINIVNETDDGYTSEYRYLYQNVDINFYRVYEGKNVYYYSKDKKYELIHIKRFNPNIFGFYNYGLSKLHSLYYELLQFLATSIHNSGLLENGCRPSGILMSEEPLTNEQLNDLRSEYENVFQGATNAGRPLISNKLTWTDFTHTNRDMDFINLKSQLKEMIYNRMKIPLALINSNALSLANMEVAMLQLYDMAILPLADCIYNSLTFYFLNRFGETNLSLVYDPSTINALRERNVEQVLNMTKMNIFTDNELRNRLDFQDYDQGNIVYKPSTYVPSGEVKN